MCSRILVKFDSAYYQFIRSRFSEEASKNAVRSYITSCQQCGNCSKNAQKRSSKYDQKSSNLLEKIKNTSINVSAKDFSSSSRVDAFAKDLFLGKFNKVGMNTRNFPFRSHFSYSIVCKHIMC